MRVTTRLIVCVMLGVAFAQGVHASGSRIKSQWLRDWVMQTKPDRPSSGKPAQATYSGVGGAETVGAQRPSCQVREIGEPCPRGGVATMGSPFPVNDQGVGNPIDIRNGNKHQRETDLPDSAIHPGLELVRHYNSMDNRVNALGRGWRWSFDSRLYQVSVGEIQIIQADGSRLQFGVRGKDGVFQAKQPRRGQIHRMASGQWRWVWPTGSELTFDTSGMLVSVMHPRQGVHLQISWQQIGNSHLRVIREVATIGGLSGKLRFDYRTDTVTPYLKSVTTPYGVFEYRFEGTEPNLRLTWVLRPDGMKKQYHYEPERQSGQAQVMTGISIWSTDGDARDRRQSWTYDSSGRAQSFEDDQVNWIRDQARVTYLHSSEMDAQPLFAFKERLVKDDGDRLLSRSFGAGRSWDWKYDLHGRVISMRAKLGKQSTETRIVWKSLRPVVISHPEQTEIRRYDRTGEMRERIFIRPAKDQLHPWMFRERFLLDQDGRRIGHALPEGGTLRYAWHTDGKLAKLEWIQKDGRPHEVIRSMPAGYRYGNGLYAVGMMGPQGLLDWMVYQPFMRAALFRQQILLNAAGRIEKEWISVPPWKEVFSYRYDDASRLVAYRHQASHHGIPLVAKTSHQQTTHEQTLLAWHPDGRAAGRWAEDRTTHPSHVLDASGLPVQVGEFLTRYGTGRRLENVAKHSDPDRVVTYGHNAFGEQIWRSDDSSLQHFLFDQHRRVADFAILDGQWHIKRRYLYANETPVAMIDYEDGKGELMFIHTDSVGLPRVVTDARQRIRWRGRFTPFGRLVASEGQLDLPLRLPGQTADPFTGWHDNYQRTYDPQWGHYLEPDPLGAVPGIGPWGYAQQQPRRHVDPLGLMMFAFDGTRNRPESMTNVWLLGQAYRDGLVHYISGPGDEQAMKPADAVWDAAIAWSGSQRVGLQWERFLQAVASHPVNAPPLVVDVTGFSRGAALARDFSNRLATHVQDGRFWMNDARRGVLTACMDLRFMGLFDTVAQFNPLGSGNAAFNLSISPKWRWAAHAVAAHERRWLFPLSAAKGSGNVVERPFVGAHADIGGGYLTARASPGSTPGNLSNVALQWMAWQAQAAGVRLSLPDVARQFDQPAIHDERGETFRRLQNGDRAVLHADGRKWVEYQAEHPEYGQALRREVAAFIQNTPPPGIGVAPDVAGWVDMSKYADWLGQRLGFALSQ